MDSSSLPSSPPLFDPAVHLHSQPDHDPALPPSGSNSDDLEAFHLQHEEITRVKTRAGIVIQHRAWDVDEALRSDEIFNPETPSNRRCLKATGDLVGKPQGQDLRREETPYLSSPVIYPQSSSPLVVGKKRKLFQPSQSNGHKKKKLFGGFIGTEDGTGQARCVP